MTKNVILILAFFNTLFGLFGSNIIKNSLLCNSIVIALAIIFLLLGLRENKKDEELKANTAYFEEI